MKKIGFLILCMFSCLYGSAQIKIGETIPDIKLAPLLNTGQKINSLGDLKGKVVWLEFWATWCSPCVAAMPRLQQLQKRFAGQLQVIAISSETEKRIRQFIVNKPSNLSFEVDSTNQFDQFFAYRTIPHSVLIDRKGKVVAITQPENITDKIIANVLNGRSINLPLKEDNMVDDPYTAYFKASDTTRARFLVQPNIAGLSSSSRNYSNDSIFKGRRITIINLPLTTIYRIAYKIPFDRTLDLREKDGSRPSQQRYCMDLIVPKGDEVNLYPSLIKQLQSRFDLHASFEKKLRKVYVLSISDTAKIRMLKKSAALQQDFMGRDGDFAGQAVQFSDIANYLESFGIVKMPVIDETGVNMRYDLSFNFQPEKPESLLTALDELGLSLETGDREINMLIFR